MDALNQVLEPFESYKKFRKMSQKEKLKVALTQLESQVDIEESKSNL